MEYFSILIILRLKLPDFRFKLVPNPYHELVSDLIRCEK